ncbi:hypothetical protein [Streptomyces malaysiensis]|uniref:hypothetical protein n=1 Tax=Streptomyces malaysiensis TaxID=92644 RepID=UPI000BFB94D2|nr:hypothetical protein [Streptomyces malaysiensis]ATL80259.1 hypothetical protein SMALA_0014 [Streptomyces malaysiensis]
MAKNRNDDNDNTVVNIATPGSVVGIQSGDSVIGSTVTVNGSTVTRDEIDRQYPGGRWVDIEDMDRSLISNPDNPDD